MPRRAKTQSAPHLPRLALGFSTPPGGPLPASPSLSSVPVEALNLGGPEQLPLPLEGQSLQPLPACVHLILLRLDELLLGVLLLSQEGQRLRSDQHLRPHQLPAWPWLPDASASANLTVLKKHWLFVWNEGELIQKELPFLAL